MIFDLVKDFADVIDEMPKEHPQRRILKLLNQAIRRDVHFIERHPTTLFQCMWNTCWWYECDNDSETAGRQDSLVDMQARLESWRLKAAYLRGSTWIRSELSPTSSLLLKPSSSPIDNLTIQHHAHRINSLSIHPSGELIAVIDNHGFLTVSNIQTGETELAIQTPRIGFGDNGLQCVFSPDGGYLAIVSHRVHAYVLALTGYAMVLHINGPKSATRDVAAGFRGVTWSPDGTTFVLYDSLGSWEQWSVASRSRIQSSGFVAGIWGVTIHESGDVFPFTSKHRRRVTVGSSQSKVIDFRNGMSISYVVTSRGASRVSTIVGTDLVTNEAIFSFPAPPIPWVYYKRNFAVSLDNRSIAFVHGNTCEVFSTRSGERIGYVASDGSDIIQVEFHPDGTHVVYRDEDDIVRVCKPQTGDPDKDRRSKPELSAASVDCSRDGQRFAYTTRDLLHVWSVAPVGHSFTIPVKGAACVKFTEKSERLYVGLRGQYQPTRARLVEVDCSTRRCGTVVSAPFLGAKPTRRHILAMYASAISLYPFCDPRINPSAHAFYYGDLFQKGIGASETFTLCALSLAFCAGLSVMVAAVVSMVARILSFATTACDVSNDESMLCVGEVRHLVRVWKLTGSCWKPVFRMPTGSVSQLLDDVGRWWGEVRSPFGRRDARHLKGVTACHFMHKGNRIVVGSRLGGISVWDLGTGRRVAVLAPANGTPACRGIHACDAHPHQETVVGVFRDESRLALWSVSKKRSESTEAPDDDEAPKCEVGLDANEAITQVQFSPSGRFVASASTGGEVVIRDCEDELRVACVYQSVSSVHSMRWRHDTCGLLLGGKYGHVSLLTIEGLKDRVSGAEG